MTCVKSGATCRSMSCSSWRHGTTQTASRSRACASTDFKSLIVQDRGSHGHTRHQPWRHCGCRQTRHPPHGTRPWHQACDARTVISPCCHGFVFVRCPAGLLYGSNHVSVFRRVHRRFGPVATNIDPLYIVGDLNIRLDCTDDAWSR